MIVRPCEGQWLVLPQTGHARLSAELARAMRTPFAQNPEVFGELLAAITHHDDGWAGWDSDPQIDPKLGRPKGFNEMDRHDSLPIWRASVLAAREFSPLAGYVVAHHFLRLSRHGDQDEATGRWQAWVSEAAGTWIDRWRAERLGDDDPETAVDWLRFFDAFSLNLCRGAEIEPFPLTPPLGGSLKIVWIDKARAIVEPWPFQGTSFHSSLEGQLFPSREARLLEWRLTPK